MLDGVGSWYSIYKKRKLRMVSDPKLLYENEELDASISITGRLLHTNQMKILDKAAIVSKEDFRKGVERGISFLTKMAVGFAMSVLATLLVPQYSLHGMAEAFMSIGHLEFFYDQAPESMRSTAIALIWMAIAARNYGSTLLVSVVHKTSTVINLVYYLICEKFYTLKPIEIAYEANEDGSNGIDRGIELGNNV
ncbi:NRT1/ PTR family 3.1-like protein [Tanacetum coccineum]